MPAVITSPKFLLGTGNLKLGEMIHTWSIEPVKTCPGRSTLCEKSCYALKGHLLLQVKSGRYTRKYEESKRRDFSARMIREIRFRGCSVVRIHVAGDFYSPAYVRRWMKVIAACRKTKFFCYTRSWRIPAIRAELETMAAMKNVRLWFSCDRETGIPDQPPDRVRLAYMAVDDADVPKTPPDLVFRVKRTTVQKKSGGSLVCPAENGASGHVKCATCRLCHGELEERDPRRFSLPIV